MWRILVTVLSVVLVALVGAAWMVNNGWIRLQDPSLQRYPVQGLDVSHHQGPIDWPAVAADGRFRFVWIKATEGGDWTDSRFHENWRGASDAGFVVGAYHFFTLCTPGRDQAAHLLSVLPQAPARTLPVAVDLELGGNCSQPPADAVVLTQIEAFLDEVGRATGRPVAIYTTHDFHRRYLQDRYPTRHSLWLRDVFFEPSGLDGQPWTVWQYLSRGRIAGIETFVDQNAFAGDEAAFERFVDGG
ncbi:MAG: hypothetical protein KTR31_41405 [Myxococcales bacterium]|nr:hypothetical protein [Myxococcales bacterium]